MTAAFLDLRFVHVFIDGLVVLQGPPEGDIVGVLEDVNVAFAGFLIVPDQFDLVVGFGIYVGFVGVAGRKAGIAHEQVQLRLLDVGDPKGPEVVPQDEHFPGVDQGIVQGFQDDVEKGLAVFDHGRDRVSGVFQFPAFQAEVRRDLGQDFVGPLAGEDIGFLVLLQIPGLVVCGDRDLVCFVLADLHHIAIENPGVVVFQGDDPAVVPDHGVVGDHGQFQGSGGTGPFRRPLRAGAQCSDVEGVAGHVVLIQNGDHGIVKTCPG